MTVRRIGSDRCALALLLLALATVFVIGGDRGSLDSRMGSPGNPFDGDALTRDHLTIAANLSPRHGFLGFRYRYLNEDGEITYHVYNRFPLGGHLLIKAAILPFPDDLQAQIRAARKLMLSFFAAAAVTAFLSLRRLTSSSGVALAATLLAFSSFYPLFFGDMVAPEGSIDLFAVLLTFHGMVVFAQEGRFRQLLAKTCGALLVGWHVFGLLLPFIAFGLASEWRRGGGRVRARAARLVRSHHLALGVFALSFGLSVLAFNFAREHYALTHGGSHAPGGDEVTLAELPSFRSMVRRLGWDTNFNERSGFAWRPLLSMLFQYAGRASIPYYAEHVADFRPRTVVSRGEWGGTPGGTPGETPGGDSGGIPASREGWTGIAALSWGILVAFCAGAGLTLVRHRVLLATLAASGFCWGVLVRGSVVHHTWESLFLVGLPLVFFSVVLLQARRVSERSVGVCAGAALLVFVLSGLQMGRLGTDEVAAYEFREAAADYERIRAVAPEGAVVLMCYRNSYHARLFLPGRIFVHPANGKQRQRADFVLSRERIPDGVGLLTPDNRWMFLYDRAVFDAHVPPPPPSPRCSTRMSPHVPPGQARVSTSGRTRQTPPATRQAATVAGA